MRVVVEQDAELGNKQQSVGRVRTEVGQVESPGARAKVESRQCADVRVLALVGVPDRDPRGPVGPQGDDRVDVRAEGWNRPKLRGLHVLDEGHAAVGELQQRGVAIGPGVHRAQAARARRKWQCHSLVVPAQCQRRTVAARHMMQLAAIAGSELGFRRGRQLQRAGPQHKVARAIGVYRPGAKHGRAARAREQSGPRVQRQSRGSKRLQPRPGEQAQRQVGDGGPVEHDRRSCRLLALPACWTRIGRCQEWLIVCADPPGRRRLRRVVALVLARCARSVWTDPDPGTVDFSRSVLALLHQLPVFRTLLVKAVPHVVFVGLEGEDRAVGVPGA